MHYAVRLSGGVETTPDQYRAGPLATEGQKDTNAKSDITHNALWLIERLRLTFKPSPVCCWQEAQKQTLSQSGHRRFHILSFFCYSDVTLQSLVLLENTNYSSSILFFFTWP